MTPREILLLRPQTVWNYTAQTLLPIYVVLSPRVIEM
jgi:hypothetical protein